MYQSLSGPCADAKSPITIKCRDIKYSGFGDFKLLTLAGQHRMLVGCESISNIQILEAFENQYPIS